MDSLCREVADAVENSIDKHIGDENSGDIVGMGADGTPTKKLDQIGDEAALEVFSKRGDIEVVSEESGSTVFGEPEYVVALDPVDGTYNAVNGIPFYSISIAVSSTEYLEDIFFSYVRELPGGRSFLSREGEGAYMDEKEVMISDSKKLSDMTVCGVYNIEGFDPSRFKRVRLLGCSSLEMCYTGIGAMDGFLDIRGYLRSVDFAAGKLFIEEAGGKVTDRYDESVDGVIDPQTTSSIVAAPMDAHGEIIEFIGT